MCILLEKQFQCFKSFVWLLEKPENADFDPLRFSSLQSIIWDMWELLWAREWTSKQDKKWRTANSKMKIIILSNSNSRGIITNLKLWVQIFDSPHKPRVQIWSFNMINCLIKRCCNTFAQNGVCNSPTEPTLTMPLDSCEKNNSAHQRILSVYTINKDTNLLYNLGSGAELLRVQGVRPNPSIFRGRFSNLSIFGPLEQTISNLEVYMRWDNN